MKTTIAQPLLMSVLSLFMVLFFSGFADQASADEALRQRFLTEAPQGWEKLKALSQQAEGVVTFKAELRPLAPGSPVTVRQHIRIHFATRGESKLYASESVDQPPQEAALFPADQRIGVGDVVFGINDKYAFHVQRQAHNGPFTLNSIGSPTKSDHENIMTRTHSALGFQLDAPWRLLLMPLADLVKGRFFTIREIRTIARTDGGHDVRVDFNKTIHGDPFANPRRPGMMILDPDFHWCLKEFETTSEAGKVNGKCEYDVVSSGNYILRRVTRKVERPGGKGFATYTSEFEKLVFHKVPEARFTLAAFGLSEPGSRGDPEPSSAGLWIIIAGVSGAALISGGIGYAFHKRAKRRASELPYAVR